MWAPASSITVGSFISAPEPWKAQTTFKYLFHLLQCIGTREHSQTWPLPLFTKLLGVSPTDLGGSNVASHGSHGRVLLPALCERVVKRDSIMSSLCVILCVFVCLFACWSKPVRTRRAVTDARPIPRPGEDACGWKVNSVISTLSMCMWKILTRRLRIRLLPKGVWAVVSSVWS